MNATTCPSCGSGAYTDGCWRGKMNVLTRSDSASALTFKAPFGTDRVSNDLVATGGGFPMPHKTPDARRKYRLEYQRRKYGYQPRPAYATVCQVEGCSPPRPRLTRGFCDKHYSQWRRWGHPTERPQGIVGAAICTHPHDKERDRCWACYVFQVNAEARQSLEARWWAKVDVDGPVSERRPDLGQCWLWTGSKSPLGYGHMMVSSNPRRFANAHRVGYELIIGLFPKGLQFDHLCFNPPCVNPFHGEAVTRRENVLRSSALSAKRARVTHCPQGHEYNDVNTYRDSKNRRECRACKRERARKK